jgi:hypothetical protein
MNMPRKEFFMNVLAVIKHLYRTFEETLSTLLTSILAKVVELVPNSPPSLQKVIDEAKSNTDIFNKAIWRVRKNEMTEKIELADYYRDMSYDAFVRRVDADMSRIKKPEIAANAKKIDAILVQVGKIKIRNYPDQSAQIVQLLELLGKPENAALIEANGITDLVDDLKLNQKEFEKLWNSRGPEVPQPEKIPELRVAMNTVLGSFEQLFKKLEVYADDIGEPYITVIGAVNHLISEAEKVQRSRAARSGTEEKTPVSPIDAIAVTNDLTTATK